VRQHFRRNRFEITWERLETMDGVFKVGQEVKVKLVDVDKKTGKFRLSTKALIPRPPRREESEPSA